MADFYAKYPPTVSSGGGVSTYSTFAAFPPTPADGTLAIALDTHILYEYNAGTLTYVAIGGPGAVLSIGTVDTGTPSANGAQIIANALVLQSASATLPGLVNNTTQSFSGNKTFTGTIVASNLSGTNTGDVTIGTASGLSLAGQVLSLQLATTSLTGALSSTDWNTFNNKQSALTFGSISTATTGLNIVNGANSTVGPNVTLNIDTASGSQPGLLSAADWTTFNSKQSALTFGSISTSTTGVTIGSGANSTVGPNVTVNIQNATTSQNGLLTSTDWNTFNGKQASGNYITALTGDVTATGPGSVAATIAANAVTNSKLAQMAAHTYKGNNTGSTANAADITSTQLTADLNLFTTSLQGLVPASGGGTSNFLRADGTFAAPPGGSGNLTAYGILSGNIVPYICFGQHMQVANYTLSNVYLGMLNSGSSGSTVVRVNQYTAGSFVASATASISASSSNPSTATAALSSSLSLVAGDLVTFDLVSGAEGAPESLTIEY